MSLALNHLLTNDHKSSMRAIQKAILANPSSLQLRYNLNILVYNWS